MDKLDVIFSLQKAFDSEIVEKRQLQDISIDQWIQKESLALFSEVNELLSEVNFKWWKNPKELNMDNIKGELIDILHFLASICIKVGMTPDEVYSRYIAKNQENFDRQYGKSEKKGYNLSDLKQEEAK